MRLTVVGCGDAFGSGGRLQTCYHVDAGASRFLIDCGATALIGLNRLDLDPNTIGTIFISHLHGDHFSGLVWWLLHAQHVARRREALDVVGPVGIEARFRAAAEALFPRSTLTPLRFHELTDQTPLSIGAATVTPFEVVHPSGAPPYALRIACGGRTIAFSGDTEWVDNVAAAGRDADLLIIECHGYEARVPYHMCWQQIEPQLADIGARRVMLTHMSEPMLAARDRISVSDRLILAEDGRVIEL